MFVVYIILGAISSVYLWLGLTAGKKPKIKEVIQVAVPHGAIDGDDEEIEKHLQVRPRIAEKRSPRIGNPFYRWLLERLNNPRLYSFISILGLILAVLSSPHLVGDILSDSASSSTIVYKRYSLVFNLIVTVVAIVWLIAFRRSYNPQGLERLLHTVQRKRTLRALSMNGDRIVPAIKQAISTGGQISSNVLMFYSSIAMLYAVLLLDNLWLGNNKMVAVVVVGINNLSIHYLISIYLKLTYSGRHRHKVRIRTWLIDILLLVITMANMYAHTHQLSDVEIGTTGLSGLLVGVSFCLVIGKLDSLMIRTPTLVLYAMYCYAALQVLFVTLVILDESIFQLTLRYIALSLKIVMFIYFAWLLSKDRIILHLIFSQILDEKVLEDVRSMESAFEMNIHSIPK